MTVTRGDRRRIGLEVDAPYISRTLTRRNKSASGRLGLSPPDNDPTGRLLRYPRNWAATFASKYSMRTPCSASGGVRATSGEPSGPGAITSTPLSNAVQRAGTLGSETPMWWKPSGWSGDQLPVPVISTSSR
jgi:hypothetical protein